MPSTEYDLIRETDAILLAQPISKRGDDVDFNVIEVLKGDFQDKEFHGTELHTSCEDYSYSVELERYLPPLLAQKLPKVNPKYLLFLNKTTNGWTIWNRAAASMNEMIIDTDSSSLIKTVRHFIRISSKNNYEIEKKELKKLRLLSRSGLDRKEYPKELVSLIDRHLNSPTLSKSYQDLVKLYAHSSKETRRQVLWAFAWGKHTEAANFIINLLKKPVPLNYAGPLSEFVTQTKNEILLVRLGKNYPTMDKQTRWPIMWALISTADKRHVDMMLAALRSADKDEAGRLAEWFVRNPINEATEIVRRLVGKDYQENWELSLCLAGMGDIGTLDWAKEFMNFPDKDRWIAYYIFACSPLEEADQLAKTVIGGTDTEALVNLVQGYKESQNPNRWNRLRDVINLSNRDSKVDYWLRITLEEMADEGDKKSEELLKIIQN